MERIAKFYKISKQDFNKDYYDEILLPTRATKNSAGYDFSIPYNETIKAHESKVISTSIRCEIDPSYCLLIFPRSSLGRKYKLTLDNTVGVIDSDYFNADNEGHIMVMLTNHSDNDLVLNKGDRFCQGIFFKYGITIDDDNDKERTGGFGSTGK